MSKSNRYEVKKTDKKIGNDTEVYAVSVKGSDDEAVSVWRNKDDGTCWCTSCSGALAAMSRSCSHVKAVQRAVSRVEGQPNATKTFSRVADALADSPQEADALQQQFDRRRAGLNDLPSGKRERMAFYEKAMRDPRNHGALSLELAFLREKADAADAAAAQWTAREKELVTIVSEAYQVVGSLLSDLGKFDTPEGQKVLSNLSQAKLVHEDVLPWDSYEQPGGDRTPHGPIVLALARAARPRENVAVMHHLQRLIEAVREGGDADLAASLLQLTEPAGHPFVPVRAAGAGELLPQEMVIYACGPINGRTDADAKTWREEVKQLWSGVVLDPMRRDYRGRELEPGIAAEIVAGDIEDIDNSNAVLVYFDKPSVGTAMEVFYAKYFLGLYVAVINASDRPLSPWLVHHSDIQTQRVDEALTAIREHLEQNPGRPQPRFVPWVAPQDHLLVTPATLALMLGTKIQPILLTLMRAGQSVTANQKLSEDQIAFLVQNGVDE